MPPARRRARRHPEGHLSAGHRGGRGLPGDAAGHLVAAARGADLVVVGRHRPRAFSPVRMLGSVTHAVLLHAPAPVAVVPTAQELAEAAVATGEDAA